MADIYRQYSERNICVDNNPTEIWEPHKCDDIKSIKKENKDLYVQPWVHPQTPDWWIIVKRREREDADASLPLN